MKKLLTLALISLLIGCKGKNLKPEIGLVGKWKLISFCQPSASYSCTDEKVPSSKGVFVTFTKAKTFNETYKNTIAVEYAFLGCGGGNYELENGDVRIRASCMSSSNGRLIKIQSISEKKMVLVPFDKGEYIFERE